ncbi:MAG: amino acid adenylation domain-containing protein [Ignavibacterium sp.]
MFTLNLIKNSIEKFSQRNAFTINNEKFNYLKLAEIISNIKKEIENKCSTQEKLIGLITSNNDDIYTYSSIYASLFAGKGYVPINQKNPFDRNLSVIKQTNIKTILASKISDDVKKLIDTENLNLIITSELNINDESDSEINLSIPEINGNEIAYILFTSGSTGIPKGVPITRNNIDAFINAFLDKGYSIDENDKFLQMFELTFDFSVVCYLLPLCVGASIHTVSGEGIKFANVFSILDDNQITFACLVPSILSFLRPYFNEINLPNLKYSLFCGEALYEDITKEWLRCTPNGNVINAYGPTEATVFCLLYDYVGNSEFNSQSDGFPMDSYGVFPKTFNGMISVGKTMKNMGALIVDENNKILPTNEKGEICLYGAQLTPGYWNDENKNKESFFTFLINGKEEKIYKTGDLGFVDEEGDFFYTGRKDYQIKIQGFRVELGEIEFHTREFTKISNVVAIPLENNSQIQICLSIENYNDNFVGLENYLKTKLPYYMIPSLIKNIPSFPINSNGKIDRKQLKQMIENSFVNNNKD